MKQAEDTILREYLVSAVSQYNCQGGNNGDDPSNPALSDFSALNAQLDTQNAFKFVNGKLGELKFGSSPVRSGYIMLAHTLLEQTLDLTGGFTSAWNYPNQNDTVYSEFGSVLNMRIYTSSNASIVPNASQNGATIFNNITTGREGYAHIEQDGYSMQIMYRPPIFSGPLALNGTLGIKFAQAQIVTQDTWVANFRCTAAL